MTGVLTVPDRLVIGPESPQVSLAHLVPGDAVTFSLEVTDDEGIAWSSRLDCVADPDGVVDLADHDDAKRLFWSLRPQVDDLRSYMINTLAPRGVPMLGNGSPLALLTAAFPGGAIAHPVKLAGLRQDVSSTDMVFGQAAGRLYRASGAMRGGIVVVPGSNGGIDMSFAPALANAGFAVFALALFAWPGRPAYHHAIGLEVFADAIACLRTTTGADKVALIGSSRGAEAALLAAGEMADTVAGIIALAPGEAITPGWTPQDGDTVPPWTIANVPVPFIAEGFDQIAAQAEPHTDAATGIAAFGLRRFYTGVFDHPSALAAKIPLEDIACPLLLIGATDDQLWPSDIAASRLAARARNARLVLLAGAGHFIRPHGTPTTLSTIVHHAMEKRFYAIGGTPEANASGNQVAWRAITAFLDEVLAPTNGTARHIG